MPIIKDQDIFKINQPFTETKFILTSTDQMLELFLVNRDSLTAKLFKTFTEITQNQLMEENQKQKLVNIYSESLCSQPELLLPFCQFSEDSQTDFIKNYGKPDKEDNNLDYLDKGLIGLNSKLIQIINQYFSKEVNSHEYEEDVATLKEFARSREFKNCFMEHFLNYDQIFWEFIKIMIATNNSTLEN